MLTGCTGDQEVAAPDLPAGTVTLDLQVGIPSAGVPTLGTRSLTEQDERTLHTVDLLLFEVDGPDEKYAARTHNTNDLTSDGGEYQTIRATFQVDDTKQYRLVVLANLRDEVDAVLATANAGDLKDDVLEQIVFSHTERWPSKDFGTTAYRPLPMWGEAENVTYINKYTTSSSFGTIRLLRAVALIQLAVNIPDADNPNVVTNGKEFFEMEEVKVYNAHKEGYAVPLASALFNGTQVQVPSIVSPDRIPAADMSYVLSDINPYHENALYNTIYVNECVNYNEDMADAMFLIVKGYYTEPGAAQKNTTKPTYYRIDFYDRAEDYPDANRLDILRNHSYLVNINYIGGPGEDDEDAAKNTLPMQMKADIIGWSDGQTTDVVWNGKYMLGVSQSHFEFNNYAHVDAMFTVVTNHPDGWIASVPASDSWITIERNSNISNVPYTYEEFYFTVDANTGNPERTGYIVFTADNLELKVKIEQSDDELSIEIVDFYNVPVTEMIFYSPKPLAESIVPAKLFQVRWSPADRSVFVSEEVLTAYPFDFRGDNGITHGEILTGGWHGYTIAPPEITAEEAAVDPFMEKASRYYFTLGDETPFTTNITLRHIMLNLVTDEADLYDMDGLPHSFNVRSNVSWEVTAVADPDGVLANAASLVGTTGGYNTIGEAFTFTMADNSGSSLPGGTAVITFSYFNAYGDTLTHDVEINAEGASAAPRIGIEANCYLLKPGGEGVSIPVSRANEGIPGSISSGQQLDWKFIWTDHYNGYDKNGNGVCPVRLVEVEGSGPTAVLNVYPGTAAGNVVVAVTNTGGDVLWSWHIWVSDFDPDTDQDDFYTYRYYKFMDRNLGALSDVPGTVDFLGMNYQWGRKDPFPHASAINGTSFIPIYDADGNTITRRTAGSNTQSIMLEYSVRNPEVFITTSDDWYSTNWSDYAGSTRVNMWHPGGTNLSDDTKSVYDPCPEGWRVVPGSTTDTSSEWYILFSNKTYNSTYNYTVVAGQNSIVNDYVDLGIWPHAGIITGSTGNLAQVGTNGRYWTANGDPSGSQSVHTVFYPNNSSTDVAVNLGRANALPVRCMRRVTTP